VWVPLDTVTSESGAMCYVRGSHLSSTKYRANNFITQKPMAARTDHRRLPLTDIEGNPEQYDIVSLDV
jgi:ectoine hydroxylase-related dioxygenase (phytanoyl-CoA dioxygenase family)